MLPSRSVVKEIRRRSGLSSPKIIGQFECNRSAGVTTPPPCRARSSAGRAVLRDHHPSIGRVFVGAGIIGKIMAWPCIRLACRGPGLVVRFLLREKFAAHVAQAIQPWHGRVAAGVIENAVDQDARQGIAAGVGEHGDADIPPGHQAQQRGPAEPAAGVPDRPFSPVGVRAKAEAVMRQDRTPRIRQRLRRRVAPASPGSVLTRAAACPRTRLRPAKISSSWRCRRPRC